MKVAVVHPYRETRHRMWKEYFFMPERAVQVATYLDDNGYDVDFVDFSQTDLEENVHSVDTPRELKGTGWNFQRYGWTDEEIHQWFEENGFSYDAYVVDSLTPYFRDGVEQVVNYADGIVGSGKVAMFGEWVSLVPEDFQSHVAIKGNWEYGILCWLNALGYDDTFAESPGVHEITYENVGMDDIPPPDWNRFVDMEDYPEPHCADYRAGRGCPEKCDFCHVAGIYGGTIRGRSAETIIDHLKFFIEEEGFEKIKLRDDNFCVRGNVAYDVFEWLAANHPDVEILQPEGMEMKTAAHIPEVLDQMGRCNYHSVRVGFETIAEGNFQKNSLDWWEQAHENFKEAGFGPGEIVTFVMRGHPNLTREDEIDTAIYLSNYDVTLLSGGYRLVPGTELWENRDEVLGLDDETPYNYGHGLPQGDKDSIRKLGRLFRTVSAWNEWGISLFHSDDPLGELEELSWMDSVHDFGVGIRAEGTVSGWTRTDGIRDGFAIILATRGYYKHNVDKDTKTEMEIRGVKGKNNWMKKVMDRAKEQGVEVEEPGGLL